MSTHVSSQNGQPGDKVTLETKESAQDLISSEKFNDTEEGTESVDTSPKKKRVWHDIDGRYAWVQVFSAGLVFFTLAGLNRSFSLIYEQMLHKYGRSDAVTAWVPSLHGTVKMCSSPLVGFLIQKYTEQKVCFFGGIVTAVALFLTALMPSIELVFLFYGFFYGISANCCIISGMTIVAKYFDKKRGLAMGIAFSFVASGTLCMGPIVQFLFNNYDYVGAMMIISAISGHACISAVLMRPLPNPKAKNDTVVEEFNEDEDDVVVIVDAIDSEYEKKGSPRPRSRTNTQGSVIHVALEGSVLDVRMDDSASIPSCRLPKNMSDTDFEMQEMSDKVKNDPKHEKSKGTRRKCIKVIKSFLNNFGVNLLRNQAFTSFCVLMTCFVMCLDITMSFLTSLIREKGFTDTEVIIALIVFSSFDVPSRLISGCIFDHRVLRNYKFVISTALCFFMAAFLLVFPLALDISFILGMVCFALSNSCRSMFHSQHLTVITEIVGREHLEAGIGLNRFFQGIGLIISSPLGGLLKDITGTYTTGYFMVSSLLLLNSGIYLIIRACAHFAKR